jgi:hypothetical protein
MFVCGLPCVAEITFPAVLNLTFSLLEVFSLTTLLRLTSTRRINNISLMHFSALFPRGLARRIRTELDTGVTNHSKIFRSPAVSKQFSCRRNHLSGVRHAVFGAGVPKLHLDASRSAPHRGRTKVYTFDR